MGNVDQGRLTIICGPMFSGKTGELIRLIRRWQIANKKCVVFKPRIDSRYNPEQVCSHDNAHIDCVLIDKPMDIIEYLEKNRETKHIGIDEIQFLDESICDIVSYLTSKGYNIIASGLDMDFRGEPFGPMPKLLCIAENVRKLTAICSECGEEASYTQRLIDDEPAPYEGEQVVVGGKEQYGARCKEHHQVPGKPVPKILTIGQR